MPARGIVHITCYHDAATNTRDIVVGPHEIKTCSDEYCSTCAELVAQAIHDVYMMTRPDLMRKAIFKRQLFVFSLFLNALFIAIAVGMGFGYIRFSAAS